MARYTVAEAKARLEELIDAARAGESVTIVDDGVEVATLGRASAGASDHRRPSARSLEELRIWTSRRRSIPIPSDVVVRALRDEGP